MFKKLLIILFTSFYLFFVGCEESFSIDPKDLDTLEGKYTVSFQLNNGTEIKSLTLEKGEKITTPTNPSIFKHNFIGWYKEKEFVNLFDFQKEVIEKDTVIYAKFEEQNTQTKLQESDKNSTFGNSVAISGDVAVIGEPNDMKSAAGNVYVFGKDNKSSWIKKTKLQASDKNNKDEFGYSVAIDGDTIVVGAPGNESTDTGAVYVFVRSGDNWSQQAKLVANDKQVGALFGYSVALQNNTVVVGAPKEDTPEKNDNGDNSDGSNVGAIYVFTRSGNTWSQQTKLQATSNKGQDFGFERAEFAHFGNSVAIDKDTIVVGALKDIRPSVDQPSRAVRNEGSVYIFVRNGAKWTQQAWLQADDKKEYDHFGNAVAIKGDMILVGAYNVGSSLSAIDYGAAYIFNRSGDNWKQQVKIEASDKSGYAYFGTSVAIVENDTVVVGADGFDNVSFSRIGAAYIFKKEGTTWKETLKIQASDKKKGDHFGSSIGADGSTLIFGAPGKEGATYIW